MEAFGRTVSQVAPEALAELPGLAVLAPGCHGPPGKFSVNSVVTPGLDGKYWFLFVLCHFGGRSLGCGILSSGWVNSIVFCSYQHHPSNGLEGWSCTGNLQRRVRGCCCTPVAGCTMWGMVMWGLKTPARTHQFSDSSLNSDTLSLPMFWKGCKLVTCLGFKMLSAHLPPPPESTPHSLEFSGAVRFCSRVWNEFCSWMLQILILP